MRPNMPLLLLIVLALAGCGEAPGVRVYETTHPAAYRWPKAEARTDEHEVDGVTWAWDVPEGFVSAPEVPDQLIADYRFKGTNEDLPGRLTVSMIPGEAGGVMANVQRWRSQLFVQEPAALGRGDFITPMVTPNNLEMTLVRLSGQYRGPYVPTDLLGAIILVRTPGGEVMQSWFFKMVGDRETIDANTHLFPRVYTSFRVTDIDPELMAQFRALMAELQAEAERNAKDDAENPGEAADGDAPAEDPAPDTEPEKQDPADNADANATEPGGGER